MENNKLKISGFTVVEMMVSIAIFVVIMTVSVVIFINSLKTQRSLVALMAVNDNLSLTIEQMAREIRTGINFTSSGSELQFVNAKGETVVYRLNSATGVLEKVVNSVFNPITADNVNVKDFRILLQGNQLGDSAPPRVTISLTASGRLKDLQNIDATLQTTVSARNIDT